MIPTASRLTTTCGCKSNARKEANRSSISLLGGIGLALLPKCHFCLLAYSSAVTVCGKGTYYDHSPEWTSFLSIGLGVLTLVFILFNQRGKRTWYAAALVGLGIVLISISEMYTGEKAHYYAGAGILMLGVWVNASFLYFYHRYFKPLGMYVFKRRQLGEN
ncbi:MAG: hypothetical protein AAGD28_07835 [Bacteroidota bacterium]